MKISYYLFFLSFSILYSCTEPSEKIVEPINDKIPLDAQLLIFQKENKLEIWTNTPPFKRLQTFEPSFRIDTLQIGHYKKTAFEKYSFLAKIPHTHQYQELLVFPNDGRITGSLEPCFACPHHVAERYAKLELSMKNYLGEKE